MERYIIMSESTEMGFKECKLCKQVKPLSEFYYRKDSKDYRTECKQCRKNYERLKKTGWSPEAYEYAWYHQNGKCAICGCELGSSRYTKPAADHNHKTGKLRGILCTQCNTALGLMKDSPYRLESAIRYLEEHGNNI